MMQVETLEDLSSRERAGARCYETILLCKPHGLWNRRPDWMKQAWHHFLKFGDFGEQVTLCTNNNASWCVSAAAAGRLKACSMLL